MSTGTHAGTLPGSTTVPPSARAAMRGGVIGNYVDQIHIFLPVVALAPALPTLAGDGAVAASAAWVVMATLLGRPVGAVIFGRLADRHGRTRTTIIAITGTAACTLAIAVMPGHQLLGGGTIAAVILLRFLGGAFLAGEYSAAIPLAMEWSPPKRRGLVSGLIMSMAPWAQATIGLTTVGLLLALGPARYGQWGWRMSFAAGGVASLVVLVFYIRRVIDSPLTRDLTDGAAGGQPLLERVSLSDLVLGAHRGAFWQMFGLMTGLWFMTNMVAIYLASRLRGDAGLSATEVSLVMGGAAIVQAVAMAGAGHLSTLVGRRRLLVGWGLLAVVAAPLLWLSALRAGSVASALLSAGILQAVTVCAYGPIGAYLSEGFPTAIRATGYGTAYSASIVLPALHPFYLPWLESRVGHQGAPILLLILGGLLVAGWAARGPALRPADIADLETMAARRARR